MKSIRDICNDLRIQHNSLCLLHKKAPMAEKAKIYNEAELIRLRILVLERNLTKG
jgi:hypothetical protein